MFITYEPDPTTTTAGDDAPPAPVDAAAEAMAAMDAGIAAADTGAPPPIAPVEEADPTPANDAPPPADPATDPNTPPVVPGAAEGAGVPDPAAATADTDAEVAALGLKGKSEERFRAMAGEIKELAPLRAVREELEKVGIKDAAGVTQLVSQAEAGLRMVDMIRETGTTADQYGEVMDYMALQNEAIRTGDPGAAKRALERLRPALEGLAKIAGEEVPGYDPLAAYPDLQADVGTGDLSEKRAKEIATQRDRETHMTTVRDSQNRASQQQRDQTRQQEQAYADGRESLNSLERRLSSDPQYQAKRPQLIAEVQRICQQHPPSQWASEAAIAYAALVVPPPVVTTPAVTLPTPGPIRGGSHRMALVPETDDPLKALDYGIAAANRA